MLSFNKHDCLVLIFVHDKSYIFVLDTFEWINNVVVNLSVDESATKSRKLDFFLYFIDIQLCLNLKHLISSDILFYYNFGNIICTFDVHKLL